MANTTRILQEQTELNQDLLSLLKKEGIWNIYIHAIKNAFGYTFYKFRKISSTEVILVPGKSKKYDRNSEYLEVSNILLALMVFF